MREGHGRRGTVCEEAPRLGRGRVLDALSREGVAELLGALARLGALLALALLRLLLRRLGGAARLCAHVQCTCHAHEGCTWLVHMQGLHVRGHELAPPPPRSERAASPPSPRPCPCASPRAPPAWRASWHRRAPSTCRASEGRSADAARPAPPPAREDRKGVRPRDGGKGQGAVGRPRRSPCPPTSDQMARALSVHSHAVSSWQSANACDCHLTSDRMATALSIHSHAIS